MAVGVLMDAWSKMKPRKDTTLALLLAAQERGERLFSFEQHEMWLQDGIVWANMSEVTVYDDESHYYDVVAVVRQPLVDLDVLLIRKDPPFDLEYLYLTYLVELAEAQGLNVINRPGSVRDANEKLFATWFPHCCPETIVASNIELIKEFLIQVGQAVIKPLHGMGGESVFILAEADPNIEVILETMTQQERRTVMVQKYVPEVVNGDKRIIVVDGNPVPYALARIAQGNDFRSNLAVGGQGKLVELSERDLWICEQVCPVLLEKGLRFVGLDVIGDYLTEINVTSPTCLREIERLSELNIAQLFWNAVLGPTTAGT